MQVFQACLFHSGKAVSTSTIFGRPIRPPNKTKSKTFLVFNSKFRMFSSIFSSLKPHFWQRCFRKTCSTKNKEIYGSVKRHFNATAETLHLDSSEFQHSKCGSFYQDAPSLQNQYLGDVFLRSSLQRIVPAEVGVRLFGFGGWVLEVWGGTQTCYCYKMYYVCSWSLAWLYTAKNHQPVAMLL